MEEEIGMINVKYSPVKKVLAVSVKDVRAKIFYSIDFF